ncbi:hypothetical protein ACYOEI_16320 [Singulisphaera rosea]
MLRSSLVAFAIVSSLNLGSGRWVWAQRPDRSESVGRDVPLDNEQDPLRPFTSRKAPANLDRGYARPVPREAPVRANPYARRYQYFPRAVQSPNAAAVRHHCVPSRHGMLMR